MVETLDKIEKPIAHVIPEVIANIIIPIVLIIIIFVFDWRIGIANLLTIPLGLLFSALVMRGYEEKSKRYQEASKCLDYFNAVDILNHSSIHSFRCFLIPFRLFFIASHNQCGK